MPFVPHHPPAMPSFSQRHPQPTVPTHSVFTGQYQQAPTEGMYGPSSEIAGAEGGAYLRNWTDPPSSLPDNTTVHPAQQQQEHSPEIEASPSAASTDNHNNQQTCESPMPFQSRLGAPTENSIDRPRLLQPFEILHNISNQLGESSSTTTINPTGKTLLKPTLHDYAKKRDDFKRRLTQDSDGSEDVTENGATPTPTIAIPTIDPSTSRHSFQSGVQEDSPGEDQLMPNGDSVAPNSSPEPAPVPAGASTRPLINIEINRKDNSSGTTTHYDSIFERPASTQTQREARRFMSNLIGQFPEMASIPASRDVDLREAEDVNASDDEENQNMNDNSSLHPDNLPSTSQMVDNPQETISLPTANMESSDEVGEGILSDSFTSSDSICAQQLQEITAAENGSTVQDRPIIRQQQS
jgi:hypothetical protein